MAYCALDILQSLAHGRSHSHLFFDVSGYKAELWIKDGCLKRIVASQNSSLLEYLTNPRSTIVLQPLYSETFLEHTKEKIDLNDLALQAAHIADLQPASKSRTMRRTTTPKILYSEVFFSVAIPLMMAPKSTEKTFIGRDRAKCQLTVDDTRVSRCHCELSEVSDQVYEVRDLDSTNGTYLNGARISRAFAQNGDFLRVGDHVFCIT
jgi:hypothetical protein